MLQKGVELHPPCSLPQWVTKNHIRPFCSWPIVPTSGLAGNSRPRPRRTKALATDLAMSSPEPRLK